MTDIQSVPLKKTSEVDLVKPLKNLIALRFSTADNPENFNAAITEINKLRSLACVKAMDKHEASIEVCSSYCDQLASLEGKIPPQDVQIPFKWKDAFDKGSLFSGKMSLTMTSLAYERMCCLFNLAAFQSQVAAVQNQDSDEGLKLAAKLLQSAAGIFAYLKANVMGALQQDPTMDLNPDTLAALSALMLAGAQEIIVVKSINDRMKEVVTAKLASQCEDLYFETLKLMKAATGIVWEKDWTNKVTVKQAVYRGLSQYFQSRVANSKKAVGEEIARLQEAIDHLKSAQAKSGDPTLHADYLAKASKALAEAQKDNDFIYHERVPDAKNLEPIGKAPLAKATPMPYRLSLNSKDLFKDLTPVVVHQALAAWDVRKTEIINVEIGRMREANQMLNASLASMNLPAALEESSGESLPQSLKDKAQAIREAGGINKLKELINDLPSLLERNKEILDEAERLLVEERESDDQLKAQFKDRWNRTPSFKLTDVFISNITNYRTVLVRASDADNTIRGKFETHRNGIELLSRPNEELETVVPSVSPSATDSSQRSPAAAQLRLLMSQVNDLKSEREVLEHELQSATVDMKQTFLSALSQDGAINEPAMSVEKLGEVYGPIQKKVRESLDFQNNLIQQIQALNEEFTQNKAGGKGPCAREELFKELAAAHDTVIEVRNNLDEGSKFYNDLIQRLLVFQSKISDFCFARKMEKEELLKDLTSSLSRAAHQDGQQPANPPGYHAVSTVSQPVKPTREAPSRPPPPNFSQTSEPPASSALPPVSSAPTNPYLPYPIQSAASPYGGMPMPYGYPVPPHHQHQASNTYDYAQHYPPQSQQQQQQSGYPSQGTLSYPGAPAGVPHGYPAYPYYNPGYPYAPPRPF